MKIILSVKSLVSEIVKNFAASYQQVEFRSTKFAELSSTVPYKLFFRPSSRYHLHTSIVVLFEKIFAGFLDEA